MSKHLPEKLNEGFVYRVSIRLDRIYIVYLLYLGIILVEYIV